MAKLKTFIAGIFPTLRNIGRVTSGALIASGVDHADTVYAVATSTIGQPTTVSGIVLWVLIEGLYTVAKKKGWRT